MMAEIACIRGDVDSVSFGKHLQEVAGFKPPALNSKIYPKLKDVPMFFASHQLGDGIDEYMKIYLRRRFEDVLISTRKAREELKSVWWGESDMEIYSQWRKHVAKGCATADVVIDYEMTKTNPATTVRTIARVAGLELTDEEVKQCVQAGSRENMLAEQKLCENRTWDIVNKEKDYESYC
jgi:hypothetical protein